MKFCANCGVHVTGQGKLCPLCQTPLTGEAGDSRETFPTIPTMFRRYHFFFRLLIFCSVAAAVVSVILNLALRSEVWWSLFVLGGIGCFWLGTAIAVSKRRNIPKNILYQVVFLSVCAVLWDVSTHWHKWSINYVIPIACTLAMLSLGTIAKVMRLPERDYIVYLLIDCFFGIVPLVFYLLGMLDVALPSLICVGVSILSLTALIVFEGEHMKNELNRRLHL